MSRALLANVVDYVEGKPRALEVGSWRAHLRRAGRTEEGPDRIVEYVEEVIGARRGYAGLGTLPHTPPTRQQRALTVLAHYAKAIATTRRHPETSVVPALVGILQHSLLHTDAIHLWNEVLFNVAVLVVLPKLSRHLRGVVPLCGGNLGAWNAQVLKILRNVEVLYSRHPSNLVLQKWWWIKQAYAHVNRLARVA